MTTLIKKSALASILIGLGVAVNLTVGSPIGPFLFAFGLVSVCMMDAFLYTGKVGFWYREQKLATLEVLIWNCLFGALCGVLLGVADPDLIELATTKVEAWNFSGPFFIQSMFCGMIMYICVWIQNYKGSIFGILLGVPLFIFCGFQHSIANAITYGVHMAGNDAQLIYVGLIMFAAIGNAVGAIIIDLLLSKKYSY